MLNYRLEQNLQYMMKMIIKNIDLYNYIRASINSYEYNT